MSGICGGVWFNNDVGAFCNTPLLKEMARLLKHRGPDDLSFYFGDRIGLAMNRVAILDPRKNLYPIHNEDKTLWLVLDGEIYNFKELKESLLSLGHHFYTETDGEVILHLYEEWVGASPRSHLGVGTLHCVSPLNGNFAFALFDSRSNKLLLARDRFGIKPLYYWVDQNKFLFASEIKALLKFSPPCPNDAIIYDFLVTGVHEHTEDTFFGGIKKLMPAEYMIIEILRFAQNDRGRGQNDSFEPRGNGGIEPRSLKKDRYWKLEISGGERCDLEATSPIHDSLRHLTDTIHDSRIRGFLELFEDSVKIRCLGLPTTDASQLITHIGSSEATSQFGALLSGGMDSSSVVAVLNKFTSPITFSSCREDAHLDERKYIESVTQELALESAYNFPDSKELWKDIGKFIWHQDEPIRGASTWDHFSIMKFAQGRGAKILFDGQGGDETLFGYTPYFPQFLKELGKKFELFKLIKEFIAGFDLVELAIKERILGKQNPNEFLSYDFTHKFEGREESILKELFPSTITEKSYYAITKYSLAFLLKETERNSSAFGIETRIPFLDHRLVEYVFSLPLDYKIRNGWTKWILREAMHGILPELVRKRRKKVGFGTPEVRWLRELGSEIEELFNSREFKTRGYWNAEKISKNFSDFCKGKRIQPDFFWRVVSLEIWFRVFLNSN